MENISASPNETGSPEAFLSLAERSIGFGAWKVDLATLEMQVSDQFFELWGLDPNGFTGTPDYFISLLEDDQLQKIRDSINRAAAEGSRFAFDARFTHPIDKTERVFLVHGELTVGNDGKATSMVGISYDITDREKIERELNATEKRFRAIFDNIPSAVVVRDLDTRYVLANPAAEEAAGLGPGEVIGKSLDEAYPDIAEAQKLRDAEVARTGVPVREESTYFRDGEERVYDAVTFPLRDDKGAVVEIFTVVADVTERAAFEAEIRERDRWEERIQSAIDEGRLKVYSQPIVDLHSRKVVSYELLARMEEDVKLLTPKDFVPAAEQFGLIHRIDLWMTGQASSITENVHVNISPVTLDDVSARSRLIEIIARSRSEGLAIEITETASPERLQAAQAFAASIRDFGCAIALDHFGVGFGSMTYLRSLPLSFLKIDRQFIIGLTRSRENQRLVEGIVGLARGLGLKTIAEGVEDEQTTTILEKVGVDLVQGYHLGRPQPHQTRTGH